MGEREPRLRRYGFTVQQILAGSAGIRAELQRVRDLLRRRGGDDAERHEREIDHLEQTMAKLAARRNDLEEQTSEVEQTSLAKAEADAQAHVEAAEMEQDRKLYERQLAVVRDRRATIDKARRALERVCVRLDLAEHQLKQLRLDLTRSEAGAVSTPELSSRLMDIRHDADAGEQVDELLA